MRRVFSILCTAVSILMFLTAGETGCSAQCIANRYILLFRLFQAYIAVVAFLFTSTRRFDVEIDQLS